MFRQCDHSFRFLCMLLALLLVCHRSCVGYANAQALDLCGPAYFSNRIVTGGTTVEVDIPEYYTAISCYFTGLVTMSFVNLDAKSLYPGVADPAFRFDVIQSTVYTGAALYFVGVSADRAPFTIPFRILISGVTFQTNAIFNFLGCMPANSYIIIKGCGFTATGLNQYSAFTKTNWAYSVGFMHQKAFDFLANSYVLISGNTFQMYTPATAAVPLFFSSINLGYNASVMIYQNYFGVEETASTIETYAITFAFRGNVAPETPESSPCKIIFCGNGSSFRIEGNNFILTTYGNGAKMVVSPNGFALLNSSISDTLVTFANNYAEMSGITNYEFSSADFFGAIEAAQLLWLNNEVQATYSTGFYVANISVPPNGEYLFQGNSFSIQQTNPMTLSFLSTKLINISRGGKMVILDNTVTATNKARLAGVYLLNVTQASIATFAGARLYYCRNALPWIGKLGRNPAILFPPLVVTRVKGFYGCTATGSQTITQTITTTPSHTTSMYPTNTFNKAVVKVKTRTGQSTRSASVTVTYTNTITGSVSSSASPSTSRTPPTRRTATPLYIHVRTRTLRLSATTTRSITPPKSPVGPRTATHLETKTVAVAATRTYKRTLTRGLDAPRSISRSLESSSSESRSKQMSRTQPKDVHTMTTSLKPAITLSYARMATHTQAHSQTRHLKSQTRTHNVMHSASRTATLLIMTQFGERTLTHKATRTLRLNRRTATIEMSEAELVYENETSAPIVVIKPPLPADTTSGVGAVGVIGGGASAADAQSASVASMAACANPSSSEKDSLYRSISPLAVADSCAGALIGNLILIVAACLVCVVGTVVAKKTIVAKDEVPSWQSAMAIVRAPSIALVAACFSLNSAAVCGAEYVHEGSKAGIALWAWCVLVVLGLPILAFLLGTRRYNEVNYPSCLPLIVLPKGYFHVKRDDYSEIFRCPSMMFASVVGPYRYPWAGIAITSTLSSIATWPTVLPEAGSEFCSAMYWFSTILHFIFALFVLGVRPRRLILSDLCHGVSLLLNGVLVAMAARQLDGGPPLDPAASESIGYVIVVLTIVRALHSIGLAVYYFRRSGSDMVSSLVLLLGTDSGAEAALLPGGAKLVETYAWVYYGFLWDGKLKNAAQNNSTFFPDMDILQEEGGPTNLGLHRPLVVADEFLEMEEGINLGLPPIKSPVTGRAPLFELSLSSDDDLPPPPRKRPPAPSAVKYVPPAAVQAPAVLQPTPKIVEAKPKPPAAPKVNSTSSKATAVRTSTKAPAPKTKKVPPKPSKKPLLNPSSSESTDSIE